MRIIVTGGAGFIGSAVVRYLLDKTDAQVLNLDKLTYAGNLLSLSGYDRNPRYGFIQGDICDAALVRKAVHEFDPDAILHLAAESHVDRSIDSPSAFVQTNVVGTYTLLEVAQNHWKSM